MKENQKITTCNRLDLETLHSNLHSITHVVIEVHMILRNFVVLTWMRDTLELV